METRAELLKEFGVKRVYSTVNARYLLIMGIDMGKQMPIRTNFDNYDPNGSLHKGGENQLFLDEDHTEITRENLEKLRKRNQAIMTHEVKIALLDDDDKLATEVSCYGTKVIAPDGYLIGNVVNTRDKNFVVEFVAKKKPIKTWDDVKETFIANIGKEEEGYGTLIGDFTYYSFSNERLYLHAIAEAKISQIFAQGYYKLRYKDSVGCSFITVNAFGDIRVMNEEYCMEPTNMLCFDTQESADEFLKLNYQLCKDYLMVE